MIQAWTVLLDSLRMLRASKLFSITLGISVLLALAFASLRIDTTSISILFGLIKFDFDLSILGENGAKQWYIAIFADGFITWWLALFALVLALISTCQIIPRFLQTGSVDLSLSKPISRARLFLLKYLGGLLFVILQTSVFCVIVFIAMRFRLGQWNYSLFWAVPVITFAFGILHSVSVWIGALTRSTLFALLGTLIFWGGTLLMQWTEDVLYQFTNLLPEAGMKVDMQTGQIEETSDKPSEGLIKFAQVLHKVNIYIPKTRECTKSLVRLITFKDENGKDQTIYMATDDFTDQLVKKHAERYSWSEIYLSAAVFQILLIGCSMWVFSRRDY